MKKCPKCNKTYDDSWGVCLNCRETLVSGNTAFDGKIKKPDLQKEKARPVGITMFAWLIIVIGVFSCLSSLNFKMHMEIFKSIPKNLNIGLFVYGILSSAISVIAAIGLLRLKEVARKVIVGINGLDLLSGIPVLFFSINDLRQFTYNEAAKLTTETNSQLSIDMLGNFSFYFMISFCIFILLLSMLLIYFFTRPKVKQQFAGTKS